MLHYEDITVTAVGTVAGSAVGTAWGKQVVSGEIVAVHFNYSGTPTTTDATLLTAHSPQTTILGVANSITDGWYYPQVAQQGTAGAAITYDGTRPIYGRIPVIDHLELRIAQAEEDDTLTARVVWRD